MKTWDPIQAHEDARRLQDQLALVRADNADLRYALWRLFEDSTAAGHPDLLAVYEHAVGDTP